MIADIQPLDQINDEALDVLMKEVGVANTARFIQQFTTGMGNYTEERRELFKDLTLDNAIAQIKERRKENT